MVGILVQGSDHFIVRGPLPDRSTAIALARHWTVIQIGSTTPTEIQQWQVAYREFRENLQWAVVIPSDEETTPAVKTLLNELSARGVPIHDAALESW